MSDSMGELSQNGQAFKTERYTFILIDQTSS